MRVAVYSGGVCGVDRLRKCITDMECTTGVALHFDYYSSREELVWDIDQGAAFDLAVIDREWNVAGMIRRMQGKLEILMIATGINKCLYDLQPCYIVYEPINTVKFARVFEKIVFEEDRNPGFTFSSGRARYRLNIHEIMYFESMKRLIRVTGMDGQYSFYGSMGELENRVNTYYRGFVRVHESYIVNMEHVRMLEMGRLIMRDGSEINISAGHRAEVRHAWKRMSDRDGP